MTLLPGVSDVGGYTISYVTDGVVVCSECANKYDQQTKEKLEQFIHWEGPTLNCEECNEEIKSEYGNPEEAE